MALTVGYANAPLAVPLTAPAIDATSERFIHRVINRF
ncbi:hypothetical protein DFO66_10993 [Brevibacterium sanguinis]|uniref:Uncharacterized protein n=2 Tax=Brevibacterium TaxID=1696 RepID=A0A366IG31_9MICO|nr:hypothetical protein DFO66_10993 [Brevibacterium sanguinis]RBP70321.1 hypothetical protein DFO65_10993 [Brevibacterium celere]